jgi:hypothetical protein
MGYLCGRPDDQFGINRCDPRADLGACLEPDPPVEQLPQATAETSGHRNIWDGTKRLAVENHLKLAVQDPVNAGTLQELLEKFLGFG